MSNALVTAIDSMQSDLRLMETLSQNMVNVSTPGYRRTIPANPAGSAAFERALQDARPATADSAAPSAATTAPVDLTHGTVKQTGRTWDLAIEGDGYFELTTPNGLAYTRAGDFALDARGRLVAANGFPVQGTQGDVMLEGPDATIGRDGRIAQGGREVAQLRIVRFGQPNALRRDASGLLQPAPGTVGEPDARAQVLAGFLEGSNVAPMREMVTMLQTTRHFESAQKLYQGYDDMLGNAIQKLGQF